MEKIFVLLLFIWKASSQLCPNTWSVYMPGTTTANVALNFLGDTIDFEVRRSIDYRCINNQVEFNTIRQLLRASFNSWRCSSFSGFGSCSGPCNSKVVNITVNCNNKGISLSNQFAFLNRNCDKSYWSSWRELTDCSTFTVAAFERECVDCEGNVFPTVSYCNGSRTRIEQCVPYWGEWGEAGECTSFNCSSTGQRVRRRICFHANESKASDPQECLNGSEIMTEQCSFNTTTCFENNSVLHAVVGAGAGLAVILALITIIVCSKCLPNKKSTKRPTDTSTYLEPIRQEPAYLEPAHIESAYATASDHVYHIVDRPEETPKQSAFLNVYFNDHVAVPASSEIYNTIDQPQNQAESTYDYDKINIPGLNGLKHTYR